VIGPRHIRMIRAFLRYGFRELHPFEVQALLTPACNLRCTYCRCYELGTPEMSTEQWTAILRGLARLGTQRVKFQGGEPTIRKDFAELCRVSRESGITTAVVTNGIRLVAEPALFEVLDEVVVSLDSVEPGVHDRLRGHGSHARAVRALELAREKGVAAYANMVVSTATLDELPAMLDFCEARGLRLNAQPITFGREAFGSDIHGLSLSPDQHRAMHLRLVGWKREGRPLMFSAAAYRHAARWDDPSTLTRRSRGDSGCMAGRFYVHIESNGDVWPCSMHGADFRAKNILSDGLEEALRNARHHNCADCYHAYLCERRLLARFDPRAILELLTRR